MENIGITKEQAEKELKMLKSSYDMYEKTKKQTKKNMKEALNDDGSKRFTQAQINERISMIEETQAEVIKKYVAFGGNEEDLKKKVYKTPSEVLDIDIFEYLSKENENSDDDEYDEFTVANTPYPKEEISLEDLGDSSDNDILFDEEETTSKKETFDDLIEDETFIPNRGDILSDTNFDVVSLPSRGECYKNKMSKIPVSYLNAYDENIITAPNLYRDNTVIDTILKRKLMNDSISCDELLEGDRDAIVLFLRATGFGNMYPITITDNLTGKQFDTEIDLSTLKFKKFNLTGDENGWFDFILPVSKKKLKFRFLNHKCYRILEQRDDIENEYIKKNKLNEISALLDFYLDSDKRLSGDEKITLRNSINSINKWSEGIGEENSEGYTRTFTNALELSIMSIDDITDRKYIRNFVRNMNIRDSSAFKKYIEENEPGIDYNIEVERPKSLGGGSMKVFLQIDQYVFRNVSE